MVLNSGSTCDKAADNFFGPVVASCARSFDFTLLFEQAILSLPLNAIFLFISLWKTWSLQASRPKIRQNWLSVAKPVTASTLILAQIWLLIIYSSHKEVLRTSLSIPCTVLSLSVVIALGPLSYLEHNRSVRPSTLLNSYLALSILLDLPQTRTLYLIPGQEQLAAAFSVAFGIKLILLLLEAWDKSAILTETYQTLATETVSGILSRSLFLWMNSLFIRGYTKMIQCDDLGPIDEKLGSSRLHEQLQDVWIKQKHTRAVRLPLLRSLWIAFHWSILSPILPRLCYAGFLFAQPFLIDRATSYLSQPVDALEKDIGYGLIGASACIYLGIAISTALYQHQLYRHITMVRGAVVSLIYTQTMTFEDQFDDPSAAVTLMSSDVDRVCQSLVRIHDIWARPLELILGISLLALQIGWVCIMPVLVVLVSALADFQVTHSIGGRVKLWTDAVQRRISLTAHVLSSMKTVKSAGLARPVSNLLQNERLQELRLQGKYRWSSVLLNTLGNMPPAITPAITFITYAIKAHLTGSSTLNTSQVFTSLALITLVTTPASELLTAFPNVASCLGCLQRIEEHLLRPSFEAHKIPAVSEKTKLNSPAAANTPDLAIQFSDVNICLSKNANILLRDVNLSIRRGTLTMIQGPIGSGKTLFLKALLGETMYEGLIKINLYHTAYCPQTPWIFSGTVRQNICGLKAEDIDEAWYDSVVSACALEGVLFALPQGQNTLLLGNGSTLSGGQKQRLALARALYSRPQLLLLDDVLSALDVKTEVQIMSRLFGQDGLLAKLGTTVVLVTHTNRWQVIAHTMITLDDKGGLIQNSSTPSFDRNIFSLDFNSRSSIESDYPQTNSVAQIVNQEESPSFPQGQDSSDYIYLLKSVKWPLVVMFFIFAISQTVSYYISQFVLRWWTEEEGHRSGMWLPVYIILSLGNAIFYGCTVWTMFLKLVPESAANLHNILLEVVMNAPFSFFAKNDIGVMLNRFSQDMTLIESQLATGLLCSLIYFLWTIGSLAVISTGSTWMALSVPAVVGAIYILQRVYLRTSRRLRLIELELRSPLYSHFMESINGLSSIRTFQWQQSFFDDMMEKLDASQIPYYLLYCAQRWLQLVLDLIVAALAVTVMALAVEFRRNSQPGSLGLSLSNILTFNETLAILIQFWTQLEISLGAISRTRDFSSQTPSEPQPEAPEELPADWPAHGNIAINNLTTQNLHGVTMRILPREKIGICGRSGSGKSSLLLSLLRLFEASSGSITIDGIDLAHVPHESIRERLLTVSQDPFLIEHTVRFNLNPEIRSKNLHENDHLMIQALSKVSLWPVLEKRGGLDATLRTDTLSQGQKQLFSLARVIFTKNTAQLRSEENDLDGVLLLDEATSNVDMTTDAHIQRVIRDEFSTYTVLIVAHRLDTIVDSDRIAVLDHGRLVEFESPRTLLSKDNSVFSILYRDSENRDIAEVAEGKEDSDQEIN